MSSAEEDGTTCSFVLEEIQGEFKADVIEGRVHVMMLKGSEGPGREPGPVSER